MPAMSPRTQGMANSGVPSDQAKTLFDQGLSQMAYSVLVTKLPSISQDVVTFKVLDSDPEEGSGVGAFVLLRRGQTIYVPVVMAENQIKPLDILFYKDLNVFLPLTKEWLQELDKLSLDEMGQGVKQPNTLSTDVDIRNTVVPPTTGRYSYAAEQAVKLASCVFDQARSQHSLVKTNAFLEFLSKAPNRVKTAAARILETRPKLLKQAVWYYGEKPLVSALQLTEEKTADYGGRLSNHGGALYIADKKTEPGDFRTIFGPQAPAAFSGVRLKGYYAKDDRKTVNRALAVQPFMDLHEPKDAGAYKLWKSDGKPVIALVIGNPIDLFRDGEGGKRVPARNMRWKKHNDSPANPNQGHNTRYRTPGLDGSRDETHIDRYVGVTEDGKIFDTTQLLGSQVAMSQLEGSDIFKKSVGEAEAAGPRAGQRGIFVQRRGNSFVATTPMKIETVTTDSEGIKHVEVLGGWGKKILLINPKAPSGSKLMAPADSQYVHMPPNFSFIPAKGEMTQGDFFTNEKDILGWVHSGLLTEGAEKVSVYKPYADRGFVVDRKEGDFVDTLKKLAMEKGISVDDAEYAVKQAESIGRYSFWIIAPDKFNKLAVKLAGDEPPKKKPSAGGAEEQDPAQAAMDQVAAAQMSAPQGPTPVDMAVAEQSQLLQMQMQSIQQQLQMLQNVQNRANMIGGTGGAQTNPAAAAAAMGGPMDPSMMGAGAPMDPSQAGGQPPQSGMDPNAAAQQGMPPQAGGQPQPGMPPQGQDPSQMAMQQQGGPQAAMPPQGMDPNAVMQQQGQQQQQPPPQAMMNADDGSVESLMGQVNPQFIEQAGQLNDAGTFDAASLASMAQAPALKDLVGAYLPNLEKSLDNIGRVLLSLWMDESKIKKDIGDETYISLEDNLRSTFKGMGELILKINQNTLVLRGPNEQSSQMKE